MPTYEYECKSCEHTFEKFESITAKPTKKCPVCGKGVRRLMGSGGGIIFKGSGFYQTDYRSKEYKESEKSAQTEQSGKTDKGDKSDKSSAKGESASPGAAKEKSGDKG